MNRKDVRTWPTFRNTVNRRSRALSISTNMGKNSGMRENYRKYLNINSGGDLKKQLNVRKSPANRAETRFLTILPWSAKWFRSVLVQNVK